MRRSNYTWRLMGSPRSGQRGALHSAGEGRQRIRCFSLQEMNGNYIEIARLLAAEHEHIGGIGERPHATGQSHKEVALRANEAKLRVIEG